MYIFNRWKKEEIEKSQDSWVSLIFKLKTWKDVFLNNLEEDIFILYEDSTQLVLNVPVVYNKILDILWLFEKKIFNYRLGLINPNYNRTIKYISDGKTYWFSSVNTEKTIFYLNYFVNNPSSGSGSGIYSDFLGFIIEIDRNKLESNFIPDVSLYDFLQYIENGSLVKKDYTQIASYPNAQGLIEGYYSYFNFLPESFGKNIITMCKDYTNFPWGEKFYALVEYYNFVTYNNLLDVMLFIYDIQNNVISKENISQEYYKTWLFPNIVNKNFSNIYYFYDDEKFLIRDNLKYDIAFFSVNNYRFLDKYFRGNYSFSLKDVESFKARYVTDIYNDFNLKFINSEFITLEDIFNFSSYSSIYYDVKIGRLTDSNFPLRSVDDTAKAVTCYCTAILDIDDVKNLQGRVFDSAISVETNVNTVTVFSLEKEFSISPQKELIYNDSTRILLQKFPIKKDLYDSLILKANYFLPIKDVYDSDNNFHLKTVQIKYDESSLYYMFNLNIEFADNLEIKRNINFILENNDMFVMKCLAKIETGLGFTISLDNNIDNMLLLRVIYLLTRDGNLDWIDKQEMEEDKLKFLFKKLTDKEILLELDTFLMDDNNISKLVKKIIEKV